MAAPGEARRNEVCERCFAPLTGGAAYCPECGAPTGEGAPGEDTQVHGDLAQANLLRLRGDLDGSERALLGVLRRLPNDPHAHEMLGDVCAEREETARAIEWYELALDLAPGLSDVRRKLDEARARLESRDAEDVAETLGLPSARPNAAWWPLAAAGALVVFAILIVAWPRAAAPASLRATVAAPADAAPATTPADPTRPTPVTEPTPEATGTEEDRKLLEALQAQAGSVRVQTVALDPRGGTMEVTFELGDADDPKAVAATLGKAALGVAPAALTASLHALHGGRLVFAADLPRAALNDADPLTNVWPSAPTTAPSNPPATTSTGGATAGTPTPPTTGTASSAPGAAPRTTAGVPGGTTHVMP